MSQLLLSTLPPYWSCALVASSGTLLCWVVFQGFCYPTTGMWKILISSSLIFQNWQSKIIVNIAWILGKICKNNIFNLPDLYWVDCCLMLRFIISKPSILYPIHTNKTCFVRLGLTEWKPERESWKTELSINFNWSLICMFNLLNLM